ncbi:hypothetical protein [Streptomyces sp900116325]|uniref:hypothetical protein n=1 Tax=Streptomyces sp. 900116325 TaxID=3154295 RepID=UPI0033BE92BB
MSGWLIVLLRLPYLAVSSVFAFIRLLPMSDMDKGIEILTLRHQLAVLQRQVDRRRVTRRTVLSRQRFSTGSRGPG